MFLQLCNIWLFLRLVIQIIMNQLAPQSLIQQAIENQDMRIPCPTFHSGLTCNQKAWDQFLVGFKGTYKMYLVVHLVPFLIFKRKKLGQDPKKELLKLVIAFTRSMLFAAGSSCLLRRLSCLLFNNYKFTNGGNTVIGWLIGSLLMLQPEGRQKEIAIFAFSKSMEMSWMIARRRGLPVVVPHGDAVLLVLALTIISFFYFDCPQAIREAYKGVLHTMLKDV